MNPKFSIIVGVYNHRETLPMLIDSLQKQTLPIFDVHFCDDGSDDGSGSYLLQLDADGQMDFPMYYHRQEHKGMRLARNVNQGILAAEGEYCLFIMGDSFIEKDYIELLDGWCSPDRMVCGIRIQLADTGKGLEGVDIDWRIKKGRIPDSPGVIISDPWLCLTGNGLCIPTEAFKKYGPWWDSVEGYGGEDNEIVARLFFKGYIPWSVPALRLYHHWHRGQLTNKENSAKVSAKILNYIQNND